MCDFWLIEVIFALTMAWRPLKRKTTTLEDKYKAIMEVEAGKKTKTQIAKDFGVPSNTLSTWLKKAEEYKKAYETQEQGS